MKRLIIFLLVFPFLGIAQENSEEQESRILHMYELKLKMNERQQFEQGLKSGKIATSKIVGPIPGMSGTVTRVKEV